MDMTLALQILFLQCSKKLSIRRNGREFWMIQHVESILNLSVSMIITKQKIVQFYHGMQLICIKFQLERFLGILEGYSTLWDVDEQQTTNWCKLQWNSEKSFFLWCSDILFIYTIRTWKGRKSRINSKPLAFLSMFHDWRVRIHYSYSR